MNSHPILAVLLAAATTLTGCATGQWPQPPAAMPATGPGPTTATASIPKYDRVPQFGGWTTRQGCDTRAVEMHDASPGPVDGPDKDACLDDGPVIDYWARDLIPASEAQLDHVVPLKLFWYGGAHTWTRAERVKAANDQSNLVVTSADTNGRVKNDAGPDEWRPSNPIARCDYRDMWVITVDRYDLQWPPGQTAAYDAALNDMCPGGGS